MSRRDRVLAVLLGLILGAAIVTVFVFEFSDQAIDEPALSGGEEAGSEEQEGAGRARDAGPAVASVRIVGGAPPASGPA